jgi:hypothetical protein
MPRLRGIYLKPNGFSGGHLSLDMPVRADRIHGEPPSREHGRDGLDTDG